jgi:hypothetical protein
MDSIQDSQQDNAELRTLGNTIEGLRSQLKSLRRLELKADAHLGIAVEILKRYALYEEYVAEVIARRMES